MATTLDQYYPYDAGNGANVTEDDWRNFMGGISQSGVVVARANELATTGDSTGMQVKIATGAVWLDGQYGENDSGVITLPITANASGNPRIDLVVARNNFTTNLIEVDVIAGTPAATPTVPTVTQNSTIYEIALASVAVSNGAVTIAAADVVDLRHYNNARNTFVRRYIVPTATATITLDNLPSRKYLRIIANITKTASFSASMRFNNDSTASYARDRLNIGTQSDAVSQTGLDFAPAYSGTAFAITDILNFSSEKTTFTTTTSRETAGAANAPHQSTYSGKWVNANPITRIDFITSSSTYAATTEMIVIGSDIPCW